MSDTQHDFESMKARLDQIVDEVSAAGISLDEALALYEEAVKLGLSACDVSEADILVADEEPEQDASSEQPGYDAGADAAPAQEAAPAEALVQDASGNQPDSEASPSA